MNRASCRPWLGRVLCALTWTSACANPAFNTHPRAGADAGDADLVSDGSDTGDADTTSQGIHVVFVIAFENHAAGQIYGNTTQAPYINNTLLAAGARAADYTDNLGALVPSEPHYVWMEAGTNVFSDWVFLTDSDPSATNSTKSPSHLATQILDAGAGISWLSYQEGIDATTGACPINSSGFYAAKHDPFVFFTDIAGDPPSETNALCAAHHKPLSALAGDLAAAAVATYNFITPDLCHDMHGKTGCPTSDTIRAGDDWLAAYVPAILTYVNAHDGVLFLVWDEPETSGTMPFIALGPHVRAGYESAVAYSHSSLLKSLEEILAVPVLQTVAGANDLADLFVPGYFP